MNDELLRELRQAALILKNLPDEDDGYFFACGLISRVEAERIAKAIDAAVKELGDVPVDPL